MRDALINYCHQKMLTKSDRKLPVGAVVQESPSNGDGCGQESEEESPQRIYSGGRETIEGTLESQNTSSKACEVDEAIRGFASAKGISARNWSRPSAIELNPTRYTKEPGPPCAGPFSLRDRGAAIRNFSFHIPEMEQRFPSDSFTNSLHTFRSDE